jgi:polyisoprenoid-binding protein YceI
LILACTVASIRDVPFAPEQTSVSFEVASLGVASQGRFDLTSGKIVLDAERTPAASNLSSRTSIDTGWNLRDAFLKSDLMFDVRRYRRSGFTRRGLHDAERLVAVEGDHDAGVSPVVRRHAVECGTGSGSGATAVTQR